MTLKDFVDIMEKSSLLTEFEKSCRMFLSLAKRRN